MASEYVKMLAEKRKSTWEAAKALLDGAAKEGRELSAEEETSYGKMTEDLRAMAEKVTAMTESERMVKDSEEALRQLAGTPVTEQRKGEEGKPSDADRLRAALRGVAGQPGSTVDFKPAQGDIPRFGEARALSKLTAAAGQATVPTTFYGQLWANLILTASLIGAGCTVLNTDSGEPMVFPIALSYSTASMVSETGTIGQSDPTFGQRSLGAFKYGLLLKLSNELLNDTAVDIEGFVAMQAGRAVGNRFGTDLVLGTGGGTQPTGVLTAATTGVTGGTGVNGAMTFDNLIDLYYSVIPPYRNSPEAAWLLNDTSIGVIRKLKDSTGRYLWEPALTAGAPDTILGKPVVSDPNVPAVGLNAKSVAFGDFSKYVARVVTGVRFEKSVDFAFDTDMVTYRCLIRGDGLLGDLSGAVKTFVGGAS